MKKFIVCLMTTLMSLAMLPVQTNATVPTMPSTETTAPKPESAEVKVSGIEIKRNKGNGQVEAESIRKEKVA